MESTHATRTVDPSAADSLRLALLYKRTGRATEARSLNLQLLAEAEESLGALHPRVGGMHMNLGTIEMIRGRPEAARQHTLAAREVFESAYGPEHRWVVSSFMNEGRYLREQGNVDAAMQAYREALSRLGNKNPRQRARVLTNVAVVLQVQRKFAEALDLTLEMQRLQDDVLPRDHPEVAHTASLLCELYAELARHDEALAECERAVSIRRATGQRVKLQPSLVVLADMLAQLGRADEASAYLEEAVQTLEPGQDTAAAFDTHALYASMLLDQGSVERARQQLDVISRLEVEQDDEMRGRLAFVQAGIALSEGDRKRAAELGAEAAELLREVPRAFPRPPDVQTWLSKHNLKP